MTSLNLELLKQKIRYGSEPDNCGLINFWLDLDTPQSSSYVGHQQHYESQFRLLLDAVMDELVPKHWRLHCLNNIYRPLLSFKRSSKCTCSDNKLKALFKELTISCNYTEESLYE